MLPKKHPLSKVIANLSTLQINPDDPLFINGAGNSYPHGFNVIALISAIAEVPMSRAKQLGCKPALFSENEELTRHTLATLKRTANTISVYAWQESVSNYYLTKLFAAKKGSKYQAFGANRYIRDYDMLYTTAPKVRVNARWVTHLLCVAGEVIFKDYFEHFTVYLNYIFGRPNKIELDWPEYITPLSAASTVQDLLDSFELFEKFKQDALSTNSVTTTDDKTVDSATTETTPVSVPTLADQLGHTKLSGVAIITVVVHQLPILLYQVRYETASLLIRNYKQDFAIVRIGHLWYVADIPSNVTIQSLSNALYPIVQLKSVWIVKANRNVIGVGDKLFLTDNTNLVEFTADGFVPYGPLPEINESAE